MYKYISYINNYYILYAIFININIHINIGYEYIIISVAQKCDKPQWFL